MVWPHLDYACLIWDPHLVEDWRMCKVCLQVGISPMVNGILAIRTYFSCINYYPWRSVGYT